MSNSLVHGVVRVAGVPHPIGPPEEHLEGDVGDGPPHVRKPLPGALVQEPQGHVEGGPAPVLQGVEAAELVGHEGGDLHTKTWDIVMFWDIEFTVMGYLIVRRGK